jgi:hypothetical protein
MFKQNEDSDDSLVATAEAQGSNYVFDFATSELVITDLPYISKFLPTDQVARAAAKFFSRTCRKIEMEECDIVRILRNEKFPSTDILAIAQLIAFVKQFQQLEFDAFFMTNLLENASFSFASRVAWELSVNPIVETNKGAFSGCERARIPTLKDAQTISHLTIRTYVFALLQCKKFPLNDSKTIAQLMVFIEKLLQLNMHGCYIFSLLVNQRFPLDNAQAIAQLVTFIEQCQAIKLDKSDIIFVLKSEIFPLGDMQAIDLLTRVISNYRFGSGAEIVEYLKLQLPISTIRFFAGITDSADQFPEPISMEVSPSKNQA